MIEKPKAYDVVVVGAGMVGSALACALSGTALRIALIDAQPLSRQWPRQTDDIDSFDTRVSAITPASQHWLQSLGAWPGDAGQRVSSYQHMFVWDAEGTGSIGFDAADVHQPALGYIVENSVTAAALIRRIGDFRNIDVLAPVRVASLGAVQGHLRTLVLENGEQLEAPLIIAADGAHSIIRSQADFSMREWEYGHSAIVTTVACERSHEHTAWQRFLPEGPLAFLPLSTSTGESHFCSIVWSTLPDNAQQLMGLSNPEFCRRLGEAFEFRLGNITACSHRFSFPLMQRHAIDYIQPGLALVGDAAHTIHPLAGQGVNLGLMDAMVLSEEIARAVQRELNPGDMSVLKRYQRRRKSNNLAMMAGMEGFKRLFAQDNLMVRWARNSGMRWLDRFAPAKRRIIRTAMGL